MKHLPSRSFVNRVYLGEPIPSGPPVIVLDGPYPRPSLTGNSYDYAIAYLQERVATPVTLVVPFPRNPNHRPTDNRSELDWRHQLLANRHARIIMLVPYADTRVTYDLGLVGNSSRIVLFLPNVGDPELKFLHAAAKSQNILIVTDFDQALSWGMTCIPQYPR